MTNYMKGKFLLLSLLTLTLGSSAFGQQDKLITHFMYDKMSLNPGETGIEGGICATTMYRNQWDRVNGAPNSAVLNVEADLTRFIPINAGISFFHDHIGFNTQNNVLLNLSYPLNIRGVGKLGIGVGIGIVNFGMSPEWVPPTTLADQSLPGAFSGTNLDLNFGLYFKDESDTYYAGLSSTHLSESTLAGVTLSGSAPITYTTSRHYYAMGGYNFKQIGDGDIQTNVLMRTDLVKFSADINARYLWKNMAYGGLTYRTSDAIGIMAGLSYGNFTFGYSYDITINKLSSISRGSHELMFKYCYFLPPPPVTITRNPRWL